MTSFERILFVPIRAGFGMRASVNDATSGLHVPPDASVTIFGVLPSIAPLHSSIYDGDSASAITKQLVDRLRMALVGWTELFGPTNDVSVKITSGSEPVEVVAEAVAGQHGLIVIAADGSDDAAASIRRIMRLAPCPVWVMRPLIREGNVLAAIDLADDPGLNRHVLELAADRATKSDAELHVVHAWQAYGEHPQLEDVTSHIGARDYAAIEGRIEAHLRGRLHELLTDVGIGTGPNVHLVHDDAAHAIRRILSLYGGDLLVMGSIGRPGIEGVLVGTTFEHLLGVVNCSMIVVKPPGFVSPVSEQGPVLVDERVAAPVSR